MKTPLPQSPQPHFKCSEATVATVVDSILLEPVHGSSFLSNSLYPSTWWRVSTCPPRIRWHQTPQLEGSRLALQLLPYFHLAVWPQLSHCFRPLFAHSPMCGLRNLFQLSNDGSFLSSKRGGNEGNSKSVATRPHARVFFTEIYKTGMQWASGPHTALTPSSSRAEEPAN